MICVAIGYGFFLKMTLDEAVTFINKKVAHLTEKQEVMTKDVNNIKAYIKVVIEASADLKYHVHNVVIEVLTQLQ